MSNDYVVWLHKIEKNACDLSGISGFKRSFRLRKGIPLIEAWSNDIELEMNEDHPKATGLVDSLFNTSSLMVLSARVKTYLESRELPCVEFLPVKIKQHSGDYVDERHFVLNLTEHVDCLDTVASQAEMGMSAGKVRGVKSLVLKNEELLNGRKLFRLKGYGEPTLMDRALAADMEAQGFTGMKWGELRDFKGKTW